MSVELSRIVEVQEEEDMLPIIAWIFDTENTNKYRVNYWGCRNYNGICVAMHTFYYYSLS